MTTAHRWQKHLENGAGSLIDQSQHDNAYGYTLAPDSDELDGNPDSRISVLPKQKRWVHLAMMYDSSVRTVRFYLKGVFDNETHQKIAYPARLGPAQIGKWEDWDRKLIGRIDELLVLG